TLDATMNGGLFRTVRIKVAAKNLLDPRIQQLQGDREVSGDRAGRTYTIALAAVLAGLSAEEVEASAAVRPPSVRDSPGYVPLVDPESTSVALGRRLHAPAVK